MKLFKKILLWSAAVLPIIYTAAAVLFILPDKVASHFDLGGNPDRFGSKYEAFILPAIILAVFLVYLALRRFMFKSSDSGRADRNRSVTDTVILLALIILNAVCVYMLMLMGDPDLAKGKENLISVIVSTVVGLVFIALGNIMPKTKPNSMVGMRVKFAMDTDEHWYIANRAGGIALVISGLVTVLAGLIIRDVTYLIWAMGTLLLTTTVAIIYSYVKIKGENHK
jgi:uncharacterized membrane protein